MLLYSLCIIVLIISIMCVLYIIVYYCVTDSFIVLCEYVLFSMAVWYIYSSGIKFTDFPEPNGSSALSVGLSTNSSSAGPKVSVAQFASDVFSFSDIWGRFDLRVEQGEKALLNGEQKDSMTGVRF